MKNWIDKSVQESRLSVYQNSCYVIYFITEDYFNDKPAF